MDDDDIEIEIKETAKSRTRTQSQDGFEQVNQYKYLKPLGSGGFSKVFLVVDTDTVDTTNNKEGKLYAMKVMSRSFLKKQRQYVLEPGEKRPKLRTALDDVKKEIAIMKKIRHKNTVQLVEVIDDEENDKMYLVMEYLPGGQVMDWDKKSNSYKNSDVADKMMESTAQTRIRDVILGLEYLHAQNIIHRDLKPENMLVADPDSFIVKLADFGVSYSFEDDEQQEGNKGSNGKLRKTEGTPQFQAPETFSGKEFDGYKTDMWALGVNLYAFVYGELPFFSESADSLDLYDMIESQEPEYPFGSELLVDLLKGLLEKDPSKRLSLEQVKEHDWINPPQLPRLSEMEKPESIQVTEKEIDNAITPINKLATLVKIKTVFSRKASQAKQRLKDKEKKNIQEGDTAIQVDLQPEASKSPSCCVVS